MAAAKKGSSQRPPSQLPRALRDALRWLAGPGRPVVLLGLIAAAFFGGWYLLWQWVGPDVLRRKEYWLTVENVEITPLPEWIRPPDVREQVFRDAGLDRPLSILDDDLVERIRTAFRQNPWVAQVVSVRKYPPAQVRVELVYRRPVLMVQLGEEMIPVDEQGVVLPKEGFSSVEAARYPRLSGIGAIPLAEAGGRWADPRVAGAAEIASVLGPRWAQLGLEQIVASAPPGIAAGHEPRFELLTPCRTLIFWGQPPGNDRSGEPSAAEKAARLERYFRDHGTLDRPGGRPNHLDLTRGDSIEVDGGL